MQVPYPHSVPEPSALHIDIVQREQQVSSTDTAVQLLEVCECLSRLQGAVVITLCILIAIVVLWRVRRKLS